MRKQSAALLIVLVIAALSLAACGSKASGPTVVHVVLTEFKIEMDRTSIPAGPVQFVIDNAGSELHELVLEAAGINDVPFEVNGKVSEVEDIEAGKSATLEWTIDQPGQYQLACHVNADNEDHYANGMVTPFTVTAP
jgi:uncharacterized cupredoxin-like copper-binding protein